MKKIINYNLNTKIILNNRIEKNDCTKLVIELDNDYSNCNFRLLAKKSDGKFLEFKEFIFEDNKIIAEELGEQLTNVAGMIELELVIEKDNCQITTENFYIYVSDTLSNEIIESIDDVEVLRDLENYIVEANKAIEEIKIELESISLDKLLEIKDLLELENNKANENKILLDSKNKLALENISLLDAKNLIASSNISSLDDKNSIANTNISNLDLKNNIANTNIINLDNSNIQAVQNKEYLDNSIQAANSSNLTLNNAIEVANTKISALDTKNSSATNNINTLDTKINLAINKKVELDNSINRAVENNSLLNNTINLAEEKKIELEDFLGTIDLDFGTF